jgi:hypothetical protein
MAANNNPMMNVFVQTAGGRWHMAFDWDGLQETESLESMLYNVFKY